MRQLIFSQVTFLSSSGFPFVFGISASDFNTNLLIRCFSHEKFLISKYSSILHALLHSHSHVLGFHV